MPRKKAETVKVDPQRVIVENVWTEVPGTFDSWMHDGGAQDYYYGFGTGLGRAYWQTSLHDREHGRNVPVYETEIECKVIRAEARSFASFVSTSIGALEMLSNYVIGVGFEVEVVGDNDAEVEDVQAFIDEFIDANEIRECLDTEIHDESRIDGEQFIQLFEPEEALDVPQIDLLDPDQITEPMNGPEIERMIGIDGIERSSWDFGIHTVYSERMGREDLAHPRGYHVVNDPSGSSWEYVPAEAMVRIKRNVPLRAKRGVSDFHIIRKDLEREAKLRTNAGEGAAIQAAIAYIVQMGEGATQSDVEDLVSARATQQIQRTKAGGSSKTVNREKFYPGKVPYISAGSEFKESPIWRNSGNAIVDISQMIQRAIGNRWQMHEGLISGNWQNDTKASAFAAEGPFVKAREKDQRFYSKAFKELFWKALAISGRYDVSSLKQRVKLVLKWSSPASRDRLTEAQVNQIYQRMKVKSIKTIQAEIGLDPDMESANIGEETEASLERQQQFVQGSLFTNQPTVTPGDDE